MKTRSLLLVLLAAGILAAGAFAWAGRPTGTPPKPAQSSGPSPAWVESATRSAWLDFGSYCWRTGCADYIPPAQRPGLRTFRTRLAETLRIHFTFVPRSVSVRILPAKAFTRLSASRVVAYAPRTRGILEVQVKASSGSASYVIDLRPSSR